MNIKQSILLCIFVSIFNLHAMLNKLTGNIIKQHSRDHAQKILKRMQHQCTKEKLTSEKLTLTILSVPNGMFGGFISALIVDEFIPRVFNQNTFDQTDQKIGFTIGGLVTSSLCGGVPGATAWSLTTLALYAKIKFDEQNNKKK